MFAGVLYFAVGVFFGIAIAYNRKDYRQHKTFEQIDEQVRNDLARYKSLSESLKEDVKLLKNKISFMRQNSSHACYKISADENSVRKLPA